MLLGDGTGSFGTATNFAVGTSPQSVTAGDFNGDGYDDLMIGVENSKPYDSSDLASDTGYIVFGKPSGFDATMDLSNLDGSHGFRIDEITENVSEDFSLSNAGDVNADGFDDLVIGTTVSVPDRGYSGTAYVIFGKNAGFNAPLDLSRLDGSNGFRVNGLAVAEDPGNFVSSAGDFNGDGKTDILWRSNANGAVIEWDMNDRTVLSSGVIGGDTNWSVAGVGDFNGDGRSDILWRYAPTGAIVEWDMQDRTVLSTGSIGGTTSLRPIAV